MWSFLILAVFKQLLYILDFYVGTKSVWPFHMKESPFFERCLLREGKYGEKLNLKTLLLPCSVCHFIWSSARRVILWGFFIG